MRLIEKDIAPIIFILLLVVSASLWRVFGGRELSTDHVDNPVEGTVIELAGPGLKYGSYTLFSNRLTAMNLCVRMFSNGWCEDRIPADLDRVLVPRDAVYFPVWQRPFRVGKMNGSRRLVLGIPLDPNRDSVEDLMAVPGIGPKTAERLVRRRVEVGPFNTIDELQEFLGARVVASEYFKVEQ